MSGTRACAACSATRFVGFESRYFSISKHLWRFEAVRSDCMEQVSHVMDARRVTHVENLGEIADCIGNGKQHSRMRIRGNPGHHIEDLLKLVRHGLEARQPGST